MDKPISVGDLVVTVRGHRCTLDAVGGVPFVVDTINPPASVSWHCSRCKSQNVASPEPSVDYGKATIPLSWLKRIPPIEELDSEKRGEEITA